MIVDHAAQELKEAQPLIEQLAEQKYQAEQAKRSHNRPATQAAEQQAQTLRSQLLRQTDASLVYLYLAASGVASDVGLRSVWQSGAVCVDALDTLRRWGVAGLYEDCWGTFNPDLTILPPYSFSLRFKFTLAQPYLSKDDNSFYIIDNPIVRDKVFRLPMVRPSSWKGNLCAALWQLEHRKEADECVKRLFGEIRGDESGHAGRLIFYPTFFTKTSLEIINPHDRKTKVGKNPILFESVPQDAEGNFTLLYVPFDRVGEDAAETRQQLAEDLPLLARGLQAMFCTYGFSAKRTSGFGLAKDGVEGMLTFQSGVLAASQAATRPIQATPSQPPLPRYLATPGRLKPEYLNSDGAFRKRSEAELKAMKKSDRQEYDKAKKWWEREGKMQAESHTDQAEAEIPAAPPTPQATERRFGSFSDLVTLAEQIAVELAGGVA